MAEMKDLTEQKMVFLDPFLVDRARIRAGLSVMQLASKAGIDFRTVRAGVYDEVGLLPGNALLLAEALGYGDPLELLAPWDSRYEMPKTASPWVGEAEWVRLEHHEQGRHAANGLYYIVCKMKHRHTPARLGRGKFYLLSFMREELKSEVRHKLSRHAEVCALVRQHPNIAVNLSSSPTKGEDGWWVVDDWVGKQSLGDQIDAKTWRPSKLPHLLYDVAKGLTALHAVGVVFRELAPSRVLIDERDGHAVLTDFELAKVLAGVPSGFTDWPEDSFRAPEIDGGSNTTAADMYSFGRLAATAIAGRVPDRRQEGEVFSQIDLPKRLGKLLRESVRSLPGERPGDWELLLKELSRWAESSG